MRAGATRLAALTDELTTLAARVRTIEVGPGPMLARRDDLVAMLSRQVVDLALAADRTRRKADQLEAHESQVVSVMSHIERCLG